MFKILKRKSIHPGKIKAKAFYFAVLVVFGLSFHIAPANSQTVSKVIESALRVSPIIMQAEQDIGISKEKINQASAGFLPNISLESSYKIDSANSNQRKIGVNLEQSVFSGFSSVATKEKAEISYRIAVENFNTQKQTVISQIISSYIDCLDLQKEIELQKSAIRQNKRQYEAQKIRFKNRLVTETDILKSKAAVIKSEADLVTAEAKFVTAKAKLSRYAATQVKTFYPFSVKNNLPKKLKQAIEIAYKNNSEYLSYYYSIARAKEDIKIARAGHMPKVNFAAKYEVAKTKSGDSNSSSITASLTIPIFNGGAVTSSVNEYIHYHKKAIEEFNDSKFKVTNEVIELWANLRQTYAIIKSAKALVDSEKKVSEATREEYKVKKRILLEVLDAQQDLLDAELSLTKAKNNHSRTVIKFLKVLGKLNFKTIKLGK